MIVLSSATTGAPSASASATSSVSTRSGWGVVIGLSVRRGRVRPDERGGEVGAHGVRAGDGEGGGGVAEAGGLLGRAALEQGVAEGGEHRVAGAGDVGDVGRQRRRARSTSSALLSSEPRAPSRTQTSSTPRSCRRARPPSHLPVGAGRQVGERGELVAVGGDGVQPAVEQRPSAGRLGHAHRLEDASAPALRPGRERARGPRATGCRRGPARRRSRSRRAPRRAARGRARRWRPCRRPRRGARRRRRAPRCRCRSAASVRAHVLDAYAGGGGVARARCRPARRRPTAPTRWTPVAEPGEVLGDVAPDPARRHRRRAGVAGRRRRAARAAGLEVDVGAADRPPPPGRSDST